MYNKIFENGPRLIDGEMLNKAFAAPKLSFASGITALNGGNVNNSPSLTETLSQVDTVGAAAAGVVLPVATVGSFMIVKNNGANAMQVFAKGGSLINSTAGATGLSQGAGTSALYWCAKAGVWMRLLSA